MDDIKRHKATQDDKKRHKATKKLDKIDENIIIINRCCDRHLILKVLRVSSDSAKGL